MKILIGYGTLSGNTQVVAESLQQYLVSKGHEADLKSQDEIDPSSLTTYPFVFLGGSTWGEGESNPSTQAFVEKLNAWQGDLSGTRFAVFGLGETNYAHFCAVVDHIIDALKSKNGVIAGESHKIDGYPDENALASIHTWADSAMAGT